MPVNPWCRLLCPLGCPGIGKLPDNTRGLGVWERPRKCGFLVLRSTWDAESSLNWLLFY